MAHGGRGKAGPPEAGAARRVAFEAAIEAASRGIPISDVLSRKFDERLRDARDRALAEEIALGAVRHRASLDAALAKFSKKRLWKLDAEMLEALRQGAYQMLFLDRVPSHAAVGASVELAKRSLGASAGSFANGVLRALERAVRPKAELPPGSRDRDALYWRGGMAARLDREVLPNPERDLPACLAGLYSQQKQFVQRIVKLQGIERAEEFFRWANELPPLTVRVNPLRAPADAGPDALFEGAAQTERVEDLPGAWRIVAPGGAALLPGLSAGLYSVQDATAQRAVVELGPRPGESVLDLCAAPGTKSCQAAELMANRGEVLAVDPDARRLELVAENAARLGLDIIATMQADARLAAADLAGRFDAVLVDAPCSNSGVINRRVEARWRLRKESIEPISRLQAEILTAALGTVRPGGRLVYSTCSILPEENSEVVAAALDGAAGFALEREATIMPETGSHDGGFVALISRSGA